MKYSFEKEIKLLKKWNHRLLPKQSSRKFNELILGENSNKDSKTVRNEWFFKQICSEKSVFREDASKNTIYRVKTCTNRDLLIYYIGDNNINKFEKDMKLVWNLLEYHCYDKEWWVNEYGQYIEGHPVQDLILEKSKIVFNLGWVG